MVETRLADHRLSVRDVDILRQVFAPFAARIDRVCLFGSRATGTARENSDIDLVVYGALDEADLDRIWTMLDESSLPLRADVVGYDNIAHQPLREHIDRAAALLFSADDLRSAAIASPAEDPESSSPAAASRRRSPPQ